MTVSTKTPTALPRPDIKDERGPLEEEMATPTLPGHRFPAQSPEEKMIQGYLVEVNKHVAAFDAKMSLVVDALYERKHTVDTLQATTAENGAAVRALAAQVERMGSNIEDLKETVRDGFERIESLLQLHGIPS